MVIYSIHARYGKRKTVDWGNQTNKFFIVSCTESDYINSFKKCIYPIDDFVSFHTHFICYSLFADV